MPQSKPVRLPKTPALGSEPPKGEALRRVQPKITYKKRRTNAQVPSGS